jgi:L-ascorbate metabolism protein UlaG (beta-lactamase superfamily)
VAVTSPLALEFLGHSAVVVELDGVRLVTDPVTRARVGPLRRVEPVPARDRLHELDVVLISHLHWDHLDVPSLKAIGLGTRIHVPAGAGQWLRDAGFRDVHEQRAGETIDVGPVRVIGVPAVHSGFRPPLGPTVMAMGYVIAGSQTVYFAGDTELFDEMGDLPLPIDVALLPVWGWGPTLGRGLHLDPMRAAQALRLIRPRAAVPIHWGTYWPHAMGRVYADRLVDPPAAFAEYASELAPDVRVLPTAVGDGVASLP